MKFERSDYLNSIDPYAFAEVDKAREKAREKYPGDIIDFGVGDPTEPTPEVAIAEGVKEAVMNPDRGYPSYQGEPIFREAVSKWLKRRFGLEIDPESEITTTLGSKQAVFTFPMAYVDKDDKVLIPDPGYPPYTTGTKQREANPVYMPLMEENNFLPALDEIDQKDLKEAKIMWINYPNNPTTKIAPKKFLKKVIDFCRDNEILLISDEAYSEMYYEEDDRPISLFNVDGGMDTGLMFHSLSKRSNMTNYRIGFVAGRKEILEPFLEVQTNLHSGQAQILQSAAIGALSDESHVEKMRGLYQKKRDLLMPALRKTRFGEIYCEGTFYLWAKIPENLSSLETVRKLLYEKGINSTPGDALAHTKGTGEKFLRFAMVPSLENTEKAAERLEEKRIF